MLFLFKKLLNKYHYSAESIKNRYPCKIISVNNLADFRHPKKINFVAATKLNVRSLTAKNILADPLLVEKFHPTDGVKLGFLACGEILLKDNASLDEIRQQYSTIISKMFEDLK